MAYAYKAHRILEGPTRTTCEYIGPAQTNTDEGSYPVASPLGNAVANWILPTDTSCAIIAFRMGSPTVFGSGIISGIANTGFS